MPRSIITGKEKRAAVCWWLHTSAKIKKKAEMAPQRFISTEESQLHEEKEWYKLVLV